MRIVWCAKKYLDTSLDSATWTRMVSELVDSGHEVRLLTGYRRLRADFGLHGRIRYVPSVKIPVLNALTFLCAAVFVLGREISSLRAEVVLLDSSTLWSALPFLLMRRHCDNRPLFVLDVRTLPVDTGRPVRDAVERAVFDAALKVAGRRCDGLTAITGPMANIVSITAHVPVESVGVWTSGVDVVRFDARQCQNTRRASDALTVMYHGGLLGTRGLFEAVEAMAIVRTAGFSDVRLRLVGSGLDVDRITDRIHHLDLGRLVSVEPPVDAKEVPALICQADFGLLPFPDLECWRVSSPLKLLEYLSMSRPVIATPLICNKEVLSDDHFVIWAKSSSPDDLAAAIIQAYRDRDGLRASAEDRARGIVLERYTWKRQSEQLSGFLETLSPR